MSEKKSVLVLTATRLVYLGTHDVRFSPVPIPSAKRQTTYVRGDHQGGFRHGPDNFRHAGETTMVGECTSMTAAVSAAGRCTLHMHKQIGQFQLTGVSWVAGYRPRPRAHAK